MADPLTKQVLPKISWVNLLEGARDPIFDPVRPYLLQLGTVWPKVELYNELTKRVQPTLDLTFCQPRAKGPGTKSGSLREYVEGVAKGRDVITRPYHVHDLFNFLTYLMFPKTKSTLMALHLAEMQSMHLARDKGGGRGRTRKQDLLTLFDEGGAICCENPLGSTKSIILGHAVYEQFIVDPKPIRTMTWFVPSTLNLPDNDVALMATLDQYLAKQLQSSEVLSDQTFVRGDWVYPKARYRLNHL